MSIVGPLLALAGVVVGAVLSYVFTTLGERRRESWALGREWRERRLQAYSAYVTEVKRMRDITQRIAADVGLDHHAPPFSREDGGELLAEANMARGRWFETLALMADRDLVEAAQALNRAVWRLEWFARGYLDDADIDGWYTAIEDYAQAIDLFHHHARQELGVTGNFSPQEERTPKRQLTAQERRCRTQPTDIPPAANPRNVERF